MVPPLLCGLDADCAPARQRVVGRHIRIGMLLHELNNANLRRNSYGALSNFLRLVSYSLGG